jgi:transposase, IS5 family
VAVPKVSPRSAVSELSSLLDSPEIRELVGRLEATRWTGRPGYPIRAMVGMALVKSLYAIPTWSRTAALVREHAGLRAVLKCCPSVYACYRFAAKLRTYSHLLNSCIASVTAKLHAEHPGMGQHVAIDASDMPAYANGQPYGSKHGRERERFSDADASWGHRSAISTRKGGGFYGYRLHAAVCTETGLPVAWQVQTAAQNESTTVAPLLDTLAARGFDVDTCAMDKGYDVGRVYGECEERDVRPIIPLRQTPAVVRGDDQPPCCEHGEWRFAGSDAKRTSKWRCPTGECQPASTWIKADRLHPLIPRETLRWRKLYRGRAAIEREFGRLKHEWALAPLRVRGLDRVRLHADLTVLTKLACALSQSRAIMSAATAPTSAAASTHPI